jgi:hypothetical protein
MLFVGSATIWLIARLITPTQNKIYNAGTSTSYRFIRPKMTWSLLPGQTRGSVIKFLKVISTNCWPVLLVT